MAHVNDLEIERLQNRPRPVTLNESDWVPTASGIAGVEMKVSDRMFISAETGLRFEGGRDRDNINLSVEPSYSIPLSLSGRIIL